jgi:mono/diheme cytochrome c family protein
MGLFTNINFERRIKIRSLVLVAILTTVGAIFVFGQSISTNSIPNMFPFSNPSGQSATFTSDGSVDLNNPFFQSLGTNGRTCATCHQPDQGWSVSADQVQARFDSTDGTDPIFRTNDGSNCDHDIDVSTLKDRQKAYSLLTSRGLIRVAIDVPLTAEFEVASVNNPYGCNETSRLSLYRRPLPSTNLRALSTVMWDGRESTPPSTEKITFATNPNDLLFDLAHQSVDATLGHAQALVPPTSEQQQQIVNFETHLSTAQITDDKAGALGTDGANGGPVALSQQQFFVGINDPLGGNPTNAPFTPVIFTLYGAWLNLTGQGAAPKASIARGEQLFNSRTIHITGVAGLNDDLGIPDITGSCGTCHDTPNFGNHSLPVPLNIGVGDLRSPLDVSYLPVITLRNKTTGQTVNTTDPGRALITGKWQDIGRVKGPILRSLASRAPYFHNGSAKTLFDVINFYNTRFDMKLNNNEKEDLAAFLRAL